MPFRLRGSHRPHSRLRVSAADVRDVLANQRIARERYAYEYGIDRPDITGWKWPF